MRNICKCRHEKQIHYGGESWCLAKSRNFQWQCECAYYQESEVKKVENGVLFSGEKKSNKKL